MKVKNMNSNTNLKKLPHGSRVEISRRFNDKYKNSGKSITPQFIASAIKMGRIDVIDVALDYIKELNRKQKESEKAQRKLEKALKQKSQTARTA